MDGGVLGHSGPFTARAASCALPTATLGWQHCRACLVTLQQAPPKLAIDELEDRYWWGADNGDQLQEGKETRQEWEEGQRVSRGADAHNTDCGVMQSLSPTADALWCVPGIVRPCATHPSHHPFMTA